LLRSEPTIERHEPSPEGGGPVDKGVDDKPLEAPEFDLLYEKMSEHDLPGFGRPDAKSFCKTDTGEQLAMNRRDLLAGLFWLAISLFVVVQSVKSDLGSLHSPGPGFLPFWSAVVLGTLSIILVVTTSLRKKWEGKLVDLWRGLDWLRVIWVLLSLFMYPILLPITGYLITTFMLIGFLLFIGVRSKVWIDVASALAITVISYVIFSVLLDVKLPKGIFGL
jgi:putative tricarboxylic transport membrane protein